MTTTTINTPNALTPENIAHNLTTTAKGKHPTYRAGIYILVSDMYWINRLDTRAYLHGDDTPQGRALRFDFQQAAAALRAGFLPSSVDERDILLIAASIAVGSLVSLDHIVSLPANMRAVVIEGIAIMSGLHVTVSNTLG